MQEFYRQCKENPQAKIFIIAGRFYDGIKEALIERGWIYNPDNQGKKFHLKWANHNDTSYHDEL